MKKYITVLFILGVLIFLYSLSLEPFTNTEVFNQRYMELSAEQSKEFFELRDSMLTSKYLLQDVGITLLLISALLLLFLKKGNGNIKSPKNTPIYIIMAFLLPLITVNGFIFDLVQGMFRNEFPHWADSLGIPLAGVPIQFIILLIWSTLHLFFLRKIEPSPIAFTFNTLKKINIWLLSISIISLILVISNLIDGLYWYAIPGLFWIYYYLSLGVIRIKVQAPNKYEETNNLP